MPVDKYDGTGLALGAAAVLTGLHQWARYGDLRIGSRATAFTRDGLLKDIKAFAKRSEREEYTDTDVMVLLLKDASRYGKRFGLTRSLPAVRAILKRSAADQYLDTGDGWEVLERVRSELEAK